MKPEIPYDIEYAQTIAALDAMLITITEKQRTGCILSDFMAYRMRTRMIAIQGLLDHDWNSDVESQRIKKEG